MTAATEAASGIERVGVVGGGLMGCGIAEVCARAGVDVLLAASRTDSMRTARERVTRSLDKAVSRGKLTAVDRDHALARVGFTADLAELADRQLVIESITEDEVAKTGLFAALGKITQETGAILASNTSSISITRLARASQRPERVLGIHFFNPAPVLPLVELVSCLHTDEVVGDRAERFVADTLGKRPIRVPDRAGFVVNALLMPYLLAAVRMVEAGIASAEMVDDGMELGCSHPMGPLRLADLVGLDVVAAIGEALYAEFREPLYAPPPLLARMIEGGLLGRKTGRGFYTY